MDTETSSLQKKLFLCGEVGHFSTTYKNAHNGFSVLMITKNKNDAINEGHLIIEIGNIGETVLPQNKEQFDAFCLNSNHLTTQFNAETTSQLLECIEEFFLEEVAGIAQPSPLLSIPNILNW